MAKYQMVFDTVKGETRHTVDIDNDEQLEKILDEILWDLKTEKGEILKGNGEPQVVCNGKVLDLGIALPRQGIYPNDVLRVTTIAING
jgi:hypothetical protein